MKIKTMIFIASLALFSSAFANNHYFHPKATSAEKMTLAPRYCEIEIVNESYNDVLVEGIFDDGSRLAPYIAYSGYSSYINLYAYGFCHAGMDLRIRSYSNYLIYAGYTEVYSTLRVVPYLNKQAKVVIGSK